MCWPGFMRPESMAPSAGVEPAAFWLTASCTSNRASKAVAAVCFPAVCQPASRICRGCGHTPSCRDVTRTRIFQLMKLGWNLSRHSAVCLSCPFVISNGCRCFFLDFLVQSGRGDSNSWPHDSRSRALPLSYIRILFNMISVLSSDSTEI